MNTITGAFEENEFDACNKPGACLAEGRLQKGYSVEYVAEKLHLRGRIIQLLEADDYHLMPEPVFIKGYIRAYAKLLDLSPDPLLEIFNRTYKNERTPEKALWQGRKETNKAEKVVRWLTAIFALIVVAAVIIWWQTNKENAEMFAANTNHAEHAHNQAETEIRLTDLSKMRSLLASTSQNLEKQGG
jgi:cytoskeleton protein RodZ